MSLVNHYTLVGAGSTRTHDKIKAAVQGVDMYARQTLRELAAHSGTPKTTIVQRMKDEKQLQARSRYVRPHLTDANTDARMKHVMNFPNLRQMGTKFSPI
ncbi:hypothetical protein H257_00234 [Aphanomyces astaci]|uniref:Transposase Tc1-like domain-containing protein n=1 Tax=Aphanomyces astaci TaxID=112090 RepID=W4H9L4_APHAT|nr:hypothetical protein H257_00234 [Aphanomyces astaci]ETV88715.1 hypothetical protein H257_00234 [Aphanomyces astaci]|eukprot:XP_009821115.1 hypothetical protein H257_00234 [Aphanomyces astaci]